MEQMEQNEIYDLAHYTKTNFGRKSTKLAGALTIEILRHHLQNHGITVSSRDVFIAGLSVEVDLIIPCRQHNAKYGLIYEPKDIMAVLEVKRSGLFGAKDISSIRSNFELIHQTNSNIYCDYITLTERMGYRWAASRDNLGFDVYTLFWHYSTKDKLETTDQFDKLVSKLNQLCGITI